jgi:hypothetical protein
MGGPIKIKKGYDLYFYYLAIPAFIILVLINYYSRNFKIEGLDLGFTMSVVSFLLGFIVSVTFSLLFARVGSLKDFLATESGRLTSLFLLSKSLGKEFHERIKERIDSYTIQTLRDYSNYENSRKHFDGMYHDVKYMEIKDSNQEATANSFLYILGELSTVREHLEYLTSGRVLKTLKLSNYLLGIFFIVLLFLNRSNFFTNMLFIFLSIVIILLLLIMEDYDSLRIHDYLINISNSEQIFDLIEKPRYYPKAVLGKVVLKNGENYRIGIYDKKTGEENVYNISYTGTKKLRLGSLNKRLFKGSVE